MSSDHPCDGSPERDCCELSFVSPAMLAKLTLDSSYKSDLAYMADALKRGGKGSRREGIWTRECEKPCAREGVMENTRAFIYASTFDILAQTNRDFANRFQVSLCLWHITRLSLNWKLCSQTKSPTIIWPLWRHKKKSVKRIPSVTLWKGRQREEAVSRQLLFCTTWLMEPQQGAMAWTLPA